MRRFVIVVDTQADFMHADGALSVAGAEALIGPLRAWLADLDPAETAGVLFTFDTHAAERFAGSPEAEQFPLHCERGSPGWENVLDMAAVAPGIPVYRIEKGVFDMWAEPDLVIEAIGSHEAQPRDAFFAALRAEGITELTVIGVAADYCVRWAIDGAVAHGFTVEVPAALTRGIARPIAQVLAEDFAGKPVRLSEPAPANAQAG
ncbi:isochorismatase family protein [Sphingomonas sp. ABOLE]|uniref:cysteine hydrolase family protein n=1 Tax=Sphingomonas sp. ABOLE TaxID=1985878 RepID=UPI000F7DA1B2|nr:isochorismatase family protein [Sphingomonas sp. ABOLE]RSV40278.1 isochorismatase family protein [Sphingomonas sp. ABOLE]